MTWDREFSTCFLMVFPLLCFLNPSRWILMKCWNSLNFLGMGTPHPWNCPKPTWDGGRRNGIILKVLPTHPKLGFGFSSLPDFSKAFSCFVFYSSSGPEGSGIREGKTRGIGGSHGALRGPEEAAEGAAGGDSQKSSPNSPLWE